MGELIYKLLLYLLVGAIALALYWSCKKKQEAKRLQKQAVELLQDLDAKKLRQLLGDVDLPAWISFPDFERSEWLSGLLGQLWPYLDAALSPQLREQLEPQLKERRARWMLDIAVDQLSLGTRPPSLTGVKLYRGGPQGICTEAQLDLDVLWGGNQDLTLAIKPLPAFLGVLVPLGVGDALQEFIQIKVSVEDIIISGRIRVIMKPLLDRLPLVGALQVAFTRMPSVQFDLRLLGGNMTSLPFLEDWLQGIIHSLLEPYTLPDKKTMAMVDGIMDKMEAPQGLLTVEVVEAVNVPRSDLFSEADPYLVLFIRRNRRLHTSILNNARNPRWGETFRLLVLDAQSDVLRCLLYDYNTFFADSLLGTAELPVSQLQDGEEQDIWLDLQPPEEGSEEDSKQTIRTKASPGSGVDVDSAQAQLGRLRKVTHRHARHMKHKVLQAIATNEACRVHLKVQYTAFDERALDMLMGRHVAISDVSAGGADGQQQQQEPDQGGSEQQQRAPSPEDEKLHELQAILTGGLLVVKVKHVADLVGRPPWKGGLNPTIQVTVTVCGHTKSTGIVRPGLKHRADVIVINQELDFVLTGEQVRRPGEMLEFEVWDGRLMREFQGRCQLLLADVLDNRHILGEWPLKDVKHGTLALDITWIAALQHDPLKVVGAKIGHVTR